MPVKSPNTDELGNFKTLYVTSVSGPKQYKVDNEALNNYISDGYINQKTGEQTQFYQVISIEDNKLFYDAYTVLGDKYDSAIITKDFSSGKKYLNK